MYGGNSLRVESYIDSSFQFDIDDSKFNLSYVFTRNWGAAYWKSSKQDTITNSTIEAEYIDAVEAVKEEVWVKKFIIDLGVVSGSQEPILLYCDNNGVIA